MYEWYSWIVVTFPTYAVKVLISHEIYQFTEFPITFMICYVKWNLLLRLLNFPDILFKIWGIPWKCIASSKIVIFWQKFCRDPSSSQSIFICILIAWMKCHDRKYKIFGPERSAQFEPISQQLKRECFMLQCKRALPDFQT